MAPSSFTQSPYRRLLFEIAKRFRHHPIPKWMILAADTLCFIAAFIFTELALNWSSYNADTFCWNCLWFRFGILLIATVAGFLIAGTHRIIIRHSNMGDMARVAIACMLPAIFFGICLVLNNQYHIINNRSFLPRYTELIITYTILMCELVVLRYGLQRFFQNFIKKRRPVVNVVIYGAGTAGIMTSQVLSEDLTHEYHVVAFVDDNKTMQGQILNGVMVSRANDILNPTFVAKNNVKNLIIAIPTINPIYKQAITNRGLNLGLSVKSVPRLSEWMNGSFNATQIEDIKIEDLLARSSIELDKVNVTREILDKRVLVTGAAGSIGSEICRQLLRFGPAKVIMFDQAESPLYDLQFELRSDPRNKELLDKMEFVIADVRNKERVDQVFDEFKPEIVYHAAAYKHVPFMEENAYEAVRVNVFGTMNIAKAAMRVGTSKFVMISTDKAVNPTNVMGATKRLAEIFTQSHTGDTTHFITTRFGNVLGSNGSVIPLFKKQLKAGGPLTVTHKEITRYFMTIPEACSLVLEAGSMGQGGDIFVFDMGKPVKIYEMAQRMIQLSGLKNIEIKEIGLRPGEKLYEELLATKENTIPTYHPKIMRAQVRTYDAKMVEDEYDKLHDALDTMNEMEIVRQMKAIVPEFISNNSIFSQLDKPKEGQAKQ